MRIVAAAMQAADLVVGHVLDELRGLRITAEEFLADIRAALGLERLIVAVDAFVHQLNQAARRILLREADPNRCPRRT